MLTALYETNKRDRNGTVIWHCRCDCGKETDISYNVLMYSDVVSCGCRKQEVSRELRKHLTHVADTTVDLIKSDKLHKNNRTGVTGVYMKRGSYAASICFQKENYYLGSYHKFEDAVLVRKKAEKMLHKDFVDFYERWKQRADTDRIWAEENPVSVQVKRKANGDFDVIMLPDLAQEG